MRALVLALAVLALLTTLPAAAQTYGCDAGQLHFDASTTPALPLPPSATDNLSCAWDLFAWNTFAALNWPADPSRRGFPSSTSGATFLKAKSGQETVWESFKEKRELFQADPSTVWNDTPQFPTPVNQWDKYDGFCTLKDQKGAKTITRNFAQPGKFHNTLDETVEVAGEALEPNSQLCKGHNPNCYAHGKAVGPRVWKGKPTAADPQPIYYEVKVNYDYFEYVIDNDLYDDHNALTHAILGKIQLPVRAGYTASSTPSGPSANPGIGSKPYTVAHCLKVYGASGDTPCAVGAIHTKSGWIELGNGDDPSQYHTTKAIFYQDAPGDPGKICKATGLFGMVGLHIIQRVHQPYASGVTTGPTLGGTFIFATWEHRNILNATGGSDYTYVNYELSGDSNQLTPFPTLANALPVSRMLIPPTPVQAKPAGCTLSQGQTCVANTFAAKKLKGSVWENYHLIGTQFRAVSSQSASQAIAQPYFLANLAIETNQGLQQFMGLPPDQPRVQPPQWSSSSTGGKVHDTRTVPDNFGFAFNRDTNNITYGGAGMNMGGCMGCHGVAQQNGYAFSFVLLDGTRGAVADTEDEENIAPTELTYSSKQLVQSTLKSLVLQEGSGAAVSVGSGASVTRSGEWVLVPYHGEPSRYNGPGFYLFKNAATHEVLTSNGAGKPLTSVPLMSSGSSTAGPQAQLWQLQAYGSPSNREFVIVNGLSSGATTLYLTIQGTAKAGAPVIADGLASDPPSSGQVWSLEDPPSGSGAKMAALTAH